MNKKELEEIKQKYSKLIGLKILILRRKLGLSQKEFADILGISPQQIGHIETGYTLISTAHLILLAKKYNLSLDFLLDDNTDQMFRK